jgi:hypothetical protein
VSRLDDALHCIVVPPVLATVKLALAATHIGMLIVVGCTYRYAGPDTGLPCGLAEAVGEGEAVTEGVAPETGVWVGACDIAAAVAVAPAADALAVAPDLATACVELEGARKAKMPVWVSMRTDVPASTSGTARKMASAQRVRRVAWGCVMSVPT